MKTKEVMEIALLAGEILLCSGAEVFRVEDTIGRISKCYNMECECIVLPTGIFLSSTYNDEESVSFVKRIKDRSVDLHRIEMINTFSRNLEKDPLKYEEAMEKLKEIQNAPYFNFLTRLIAAGITALVYTLFFKGSIYDGIVALFVSMIIYSFKEGMSRVGSFQFLQLLVSGVFAGGISILMKKAFPVLNVDKMTIGGIMILVPGFAITNGIKDALYGDILSSLSRIGEAIFVVTAVGIGVAIVLVFGIRWI